MPNGDAQTPVPDPTVLTTEALQRAIDNQRDYIDGKFDVIIARLIAMDKAAEIYVGTINRVPTTLQEAIQHVRELESEKFDSVTKQFHERDTRSERESRDNKVAVDAAFAAQKEAAAKQDESNAKAIAKSEAATSESIQKLESLFSTRTEALSDKVEDAKVRITRSESITISRDEYSVQHAALTAMVEDISRRQYSAESSKGGAVDANSLQREIAAGQRALIFSIIAVVGTLAAIVLGVLAATGK